MKNLEDFVYVSNVFSSEFCDNILNRIEREDRNWVKHTWYNESLHQRNEKFSGVDQDYKELDVLYHNNNNFTEIEQELIPFLVRSCEDYCEANSYDSQIVVSNLSNFRFNRYEEDTLMQKHYDHIHTLFTPPIRGIPTLSFIGILNDDFDGGELVFFDDYKIPPKKGDLIIFPSCFMFPHKVNKITNGTRYSFVAWGY